MGLGGRTKWRRGYGGGAQGERREEEEEKREEPDEGEAGCIMGGAGSGTTGAVGVEIEGKARRSDREGGALERAHGTVFQNQLGSSHCIYM